MIRVPRWPLVLAGLLGLGFTFGAGTVRAQLAPRWEPRGFDFAPDGVWRRRAAVVVAARQAAMARGDMAALNAALARRPPGGQAFAVSAACPPLAVCGVLKVPIFLVRYRNTDTTAIPAASEYFNTLLAPAPTLGRPFTIRTFYEQMSNNLLSVQGQVIGWITLDSNDTWYEGLCNGDVTCSGGGHMAQLIAEAVAKSDASVDFGQFDNDGPDGVPNSSDDDGVVDLAVLVQPERDGACTSFANNHNIWSHKFFYAGWTGIPLATVDPGHGGVIRINSYTIQSGVGGAGGCDTTQIMAIGTTAHETGHGFGLPDLYDTDLASEGIGHWGLMGSGNYATPPSPAHMEGFSRSQLGWVTVRNITTSGTYHLGPYTVGDTVFRILPGVTNPRNEYYLIENRQATDGDTALVRLHGPGLLIWHVDSLQYVFAKGGNSVNTGAIHGVALLQADGLDNLGSSSKLTSNRGDAGDPFPGATGNTVLAFTTTPSVAMNSGGFAGFTIDSIRLVPPNGEIAFRFERATRLAVSDTVLRPAVVGTTYQDSLLIAGGDGTQLFQVTSGALPPGLALSATGVISGLPTTGGTYAFTVRVTSGVQTLDLPLQVTGMSLAPMIDQLVLGGNHLSASDIAFLDGIGNHNGTFDLGDFTAWLDRSGTVVSAALMQRVLGRAR